MKFPCINFSLTSVESKFVSEISGGDHSGNGKELTTDLKVIFRSAISEWAGGTSVLFSKSVRNSAH